MSATALMLGVVACGKNGADDPTPDKPDPKPTPGTETVINGTSIESTNTLVGLITDSKTGKGIAGVPVTDGYSFTTTDANGVYQFKANRHCRQSIRWRWTKRPNCLCFTPHRLFPTTVRTGTTLFWNRLILLRRISLIWPLGIHSVKLIPTERDSVRRHCRT